MSQRIHSVDAVRAMALFGILMAHAHNRFNLYVAEHASCSTDYIYDWLNDNIFVCTSFMVFAFLFGLSFFLQMDRAEAKGLDFRGRFCWRLVLLFGFGIVHSFFYQGDILTIFAVLGFLPVLLWRCSTRCLAVLCAMCLLQPVVLYTELIGQPDTMKNLGESMRLGLGVEWLAPSKQNSLWEMGVWNVTHGVALSWIYLISSSRIFILVGMFILGMLAGRYRVFDTAPQRLYRISAVGACIYAISLAGQKMLPAWMLWWEHVGFVSMLVPLAARLFACSACGWLTRPLTAIGRCTLTCYITQNIIMVAVLCGYGMGMNPFLSTTALMNWAVVLYVAQLIFSIGWLKFNRYGPLEYVWRRLTRIGLKS